MKRALSAILWSFAVFAAAIGSGLAVRTLVLGPRSFDRWTVPPAPPSDSSSRAERDLGKVMLALDGAAPGTDRQSKPWVDESTRTDAARPGTRIVGYTPRPCTSEPEALAAARADAARSLEKSIRESKRLNPIVARHVSAAVARGALQSDQLVERFVRPYGTVYTAAVLLDASDDNLASLAKKYAADAKRHELRTRILTVSAAALTATVWALYLPLNWLTKGFFTARLRLLALAATTAAAVLLV